MKCHVDNRDHCHNPTLCTYLGKCAYEEELLGFPIKFDNKIPLDTIKFINDKGEEVGRIENIQMKTACKNHPGFCLELIGCIDKCMRDIPLTKTSEPEIHHFESGASSSGHIPPYECLTPTLLRRAAMRMQKGINNYGKHNWKKGIKDKQFILDRLNHALEHLVKAQSEIDNDVAMVDDDLAAVVVNCMMAMEYQNEIPNKM